MTKDLVEAEMAPALVKFLKDTEAEVRTAAAYKVQPKSHNPNPLIPSAKLRIRSPKT